MVQRHSRECSLNYKTERIFDMENQGWTTGLRAGMVGSRADYLPKTVKQARKQLVVRATETADLLKQGSVKPGQRAPMATKQRKSKLYCVKIGYGKNNAYVPNDLHKGNELIKYEDATVAASELENVIIPMAKAGAFDAGLEARLSEYRSKFVSAEDTDSSDDAASVAA
jgi:hypothetical protein